MKLTLTKMTSLYPNGHYIQWSIKDARESGAYVVTLYRAGGPDGPWELVADGLVNQYAYLDRFTQPPGTSPLDVLKPNQLRMFRNFYYRVDVTTPSGAKLTATDEVGPVLLSEGQPLVNRKMAGFYRKAKRDHAVNLKFSGTPVALLKRRVWGERCDCLDKYTKERMRASCTDCWGTGFKGGYWTPTLSQARRGAGQSSTQITPEQKADANDAKIWMADVPAMERDDVVVFLDDQRRFRIDQQLQTEIKLTAVHQLFSAQEYDHSHIIYRLPVDRNSLHPLV